MKAKPKTSRARSLAIKKAGATKKPAYSTYTDVKTVDDAFKVMGYNRKSVPGVSKLPSHLKKAIVAEYEMWVVVEAINKIMKWSPDYTINQQKWYPWSYVKADKRRPAGFSFDNTYTYYDYSITTVGPRLSVGTSDEARYIATQFEKIRIERWF